MILQLNSGKVLQCKGVITRCLKMNTATPDVWKARHFIHANVVFICSGSPLEKVSLIRFNPCIILNSSYASTMGLFANNLTQPAPAYRCTPHDKDTVELPAYPVQPPFSSCQHDIKEPPQIHMHMSQSGCSPEIKCPNHLEAGKADPKDQEAGQKAKFSKRKAPLYFIAIAVSFMGPYWAIWYVTHQHGEVDSKDFYCPGQYYEGVCLRMA